MDPGILAHSLVAAHADRVQELARLYASLERAMSTSGAGGDGARDAHRLLCARIGEWWDADLEAELRDVVSLDPDERQALAHDTARAIAHAERFARELPPSDPQHEIIRSLRALHTAFPNVLTRAALVRVRRSAARLRSIEALNGAEFLLGGEARVLLGALESASATIGPRDVEFDPKDGFEATFVWGLEACAIREAGAARAVGLGLGLSPAVGALLGASGSDLHELYERWNQSAAPSHPFARYPFVPHGRFCSTSAMRVVRGDLESTGPIGWAAGADVVSLARDLSEVAGERFRAVSRGVERCDAVIGFIEYLPPEAERNPLWLIDPECEELDAT